MLIVALAAGLLTQFFPCCAFAIHSFSKVSATPGKRPSLVDPSPFVPAWSASAPPPPPPCLPLCSLLVSSPGMGIKNGKVS